MHWPRPSHDLAVDPRVAGAGDPIANRTLTEQPASEYRLQPRQGPTMAHRRGCFKKTIKNYDAYFWPTNRLKAYQRPSLILELSPVCGEKSPATEFLPHHCP